MEDKGMRGPSPLGFTTMHRSDSVPVSHAQVLLQYLIALEVGAVESKVSERASTRDTGGYTAAHPAPGVAAQVLMNGAAKRARRPAVAQRS
jgi:hypothetical protein